MWGYNLGGSAQECGCGIIMARRKLETPLYSAQRVLNEVFLKPEQLLAVKDFAGQTGIPCTSDRVKSVEVLSQTAEYTLLSVSIAPEDRVDFVVFGCWVETDFEVFLDSKLVWKTSNNYILPERMLPLTFLPLPGGSVLEVKAKSDFANEDAWAMAGYSKQ